MANQEIIEEAKFPGIFMYHKELGAVLFESEEEVKALDKKEWFDSPVFDAIQEIPKKFIPTKAFEKMSKIELIEAGASVGHKKEILAGQTKEQIIALLK